MSDVAAGKWKQLRGKVQENWGKLTNDDLDVIEGRREQLIGRIQSAYGKNRAEAELEVDNFFRRHEL